MVLPGVNDGIQTMMAAIFKSGIAKPILDLVGLRVGQMNNCQLCIGQQMNETGDEASTRRLMSVAAWRGADCFGAAERAALALAEAVTSLEARYESVPDALWQEVELHFDEPQRAGLVLFICTMNMFTRINVATRQLTPDWAA